MKLPSINQRPDKPNSASSQRSNNLPPKGRSLIDNLEQNLFQKFKQYDELHSISTNTSTKEVRADSEVFVSTKKVVEIPKQTEEAKRIRFPEENQVKMVPSSDMVYGPTPVQQPIKLKPIIKKQETVKQEVFVTGPIEDDMNNLPDSEEEGQQQIAVIEERSKNRLQLRRMLVQDDGELSEVNTLIQQTNSEMTDYYSKAANVKNVVLQMSESARQMGVGVRPELLDQLERQFQELLVMQQEDDALDEFDLQQLKQRKTRGPQQSKTAARPVSLSKPEKRRK